MDKIDNRFRFVLLPNGVDTGFDDFLQVYFVAFDSGFNAGGVVTTAERMLSFFPVGCIGMLYDFEDFLVWSGRVEVGVSSTFDAVFVVARKFIEDRRKAFGVK